jgi:phosphatidylserine/phosphatidylglycerophosphate/cardiolipin synthase-like enzyme
VAGAIRTRQLTDGGQTPETVAAWLAEFIDEAAETLEIAIYDIALTGAPADAVVGALRRAAERGVAVRIVYNVDHDRPIPVPPPPEPGGTDPSALGVPARAIPGIPDLMHHKFVIRDRRSVWTGSTNWTTDSWTREENVILTVDAAEVAAGYGTDFEELWSKEKVLGSGSVEPRPVTVDGAPVTTWFCPEKGRRLSHHIAGVLSRARRRIRICSPVLTSGPILGTIAEIAADGRVDAAGVVDATQMQQVLRQWEADGHATWKIPTFLSIAQKLPLSGKVSTPYGPGTVHDYMHAKVVVADDVVFAGSYNLSHSGEENAENVLEIESAALAQELAEFIDGVRARYPALALQPPR